MDLVIRDNGKVKKVRVYPDLYQTYGIVPGKFYSRRKKRFRH